MNFVLVGGTCYAANTCWAQTSLELAQNGDAQSYTHPKPRQNQLYYAATTVEPQSYGLHSYGILCQPDTDIEYIFGKYHQNFYKMGTGHQF